MGIVLTILLIIGGLVLMAVLLNNWRISKTISEIASIVSIINGFSMVNSMRGNGDGTTNLWIFVICTVLGWMFFMGEFVFDTTFEGWRIDLDSGDVFPIFSGGFWGNLGGSIGVSFLILFIGGAGEFFALFYIIPIILLIINTISIIKG